MVLARNAPFGYLEWKRTKQSGIEQKFVAFFVVALEYCHVCCCADYEENHEYGGDGDVDALLGRSSKCPCRWEVWRPLILT
jgi:hypothetical protein